MATARPPYQGPNGNGSSSNDNDSEDSPSTPSTANDGSSVVRFDTPEKRRAWEDYQATVKERASASEKTRNEVPANVGDAKQGSDSENLVAAISDWIDSKWPGEGRVFFNILNHHDGE